VYLWALVAGIVIRIALAVLTSNSTDLALFGYVVQQGAAGHALYSFPGFSYPPLVGYVWIAAGKLLAALNAPVLVHVSAVARYVVPGVTSADMTTPLASFLIKSPALAADAALACIVDRACRVAGAGTFARRLAVLGVWLNPIVIFDSAVQASWDAAVPATVIGAGLATLEGSGAGSGAWLAFGALIKAVPIIVAPLVGATLGRFGGRPVLRILHAGAGGVSIAAIVTIPIAASGSLSAVRDTLSGRAGGAAFGGFNAWALLSMNSLAQGKAFVEHHGVEIATVLLSAQLTAVLAVAFVAWRAPQMPVKRWMAAALITLAIAVIGSPYVQPGYVVWLVPLCAVVASTGERRLAVTATALSACAFAFALAVRAPAVLAMPACWFYKLCDAAAAGRMGFDYAYAPGILTPLLQLDIDLVLGVISGALLLWLLWAAVAAWRTDA